MASSKEAKGLTASSVDESLLASALSSGVETTASKQATWGTLALRRSSSVSRLVLYDGSGKTLHVGEVARKIGYEKFDPNFINGFFPRPQQGKVEEVRLNILHHDVMSYSGPIQGTVDLQAIVSRLNGLLSIFYSTMPPGEGGVDQDVATLLFCGSPFRYRILRELDAALTLIDGSGQGGFTVPNIIHARGVAVATSLLEVVVPTVPWHDREGGLHFGFDFNAFGQDHLQLSELTLSVLDFGIWVANQCRDPQDWLVDAGVGRTPPSWTPRTLSVTRLKNINEYDQAFFQCYPV